MQEIFEVNANFNKNELFFYNEFYNECNFRFDNLCFGLSEQFILDKRMSTYNNYIL